jgi:hypothetical protein
VYVYFDLVIRYPSKLTYLQQNSNVLEEWINALSTAGNAAQKINAFVAVLSDQRDEAEDNENSR